MILHYYGSIYDTVELKSWLFSYFRDLGRLKCPRGPLHLLLAIVDHFEPGNGGVSASIAQGRVDTWEREYPERFERFRDSDGRPPRHTFFYPLEMYQRGEMEGLGRLCAKGFGEVEVHLHHENDTAEHLRVTLFTHTQMLAREHGQLARDRVRGELKYGFVHGDWALDNSRPDGRCCGVNNELDILRESGCYADFTMPSAPSATQTSKINSIYYAVDDPRRPKSHDSGVDVGRGARPADSLMLIQGPLLLNWRRRKFEFLPGIENGCIQGNQAPTARRLDLWLKARVQVAKRPDWFFVKLHTHGATEVNQKVLLGEAMVAFHEELARRRRAEGEFRFHYVTAREMYNLAKAAEAGWTGDVAGARDFELVWNGGLGKVAGSK